MTQFHTDEYVDFLQKVTPDNMDTYNKEKGKYNVGDDCPVFMACSSSVASVLVAAWRELPVLTEGSATLPLTGPEDCITQKKAKPVVSVT